MTTIIDPREVERIARQMVSDANLKGDPGLKMLRFLARLPRLERPDPRHTDNHAVLVRLYREIRGRFVGVATLPLP